VEGLHVVGGVTPVEKISISLCLIYMLCMSVMLECYHVFRCVYELLLIPLILYGSSNSVIIVIKCFNSLKCIYIYMCIFRSGSITGLCVGRGCYSLVSELSEASE
jgi:ABC-type arginine transport system permease subunit